MLSRRSKIILTLATVISFNTARSQKVPRIRFAGDQFAQMATVVFTETLNDMLSKVEYGGNPNPRYSAGFFHTSTDSLGIPNYYKAMWTRDCGRGVIELCRLGFADEAKIISRYFLAHKNYVDHWGREMHHSSQMYEGYELDGNVLAIAAICNTWRVNGKDNQLGREFCSGLKPVIDWVDTSMTKSPYWGLMASCSELSGNPGNPFVFAYSIFGNYGMYDALEQVADMSKSCGEEELAKKAAVLHEKMKAALSHLISDGQFSYAPKGCWFNGIDGRYGSAFDLSAWGHTSWPIWHWTRQLPFIQDYDYGSTRIGGDFTEVNKASYDLLHSWMVKGEYFRKYGFVSNTGWTGMDGRHDETMCGYGQGFFTQAALMADDINAYGKCLEGIARLGYDGNVTVNESYERNPFLMNECFNYNNYEKSLDHTFGTHKGDRREIMENPGDEGNLVQEAEILKAFSMVVGATATGKKLVLMPRLPWLWDEMECIDFPVTDGTGKTHRLSIKMKHERWLRKCTLEISGANGFNSMDVRLGPFPTISKNTKNYEVENTEKGSWIWMRNLKSSATRIVVEL
ncbi:MAG: hypothetical protein ACXVMS_11285 [Flavisolibacter sp.]